MAWLKKMNIKGIPGTTTHAGLTDVTPDQHHTRFTQVEVLQALGARENGNPAYHNRYEDDEAAGRIDRDHLYVKVAGDTMTGNLDMGGHELVFAGTARIAGTAGGGTSAGSINVYGGLVARDGIWISAGKVPTVAGQTRDVIPLVWDSGPLSGQLKAYPPGFVQKVGDQVMAGTLSAYNLVASHDVRGNKVFALDRVFAKGIALTSDASLKREVRTYEFDPFPAIHNARTKKFQWIDEDAPSGEQMSQLANDMPADIQVEIDDEGTLGIDLGAMNSYMWEAMRRLDLRVKALEGTTA